MKLNKIVTYVQDVYDDTASVQTNLGTMKGTIELTFRPDCNVYDDELQKINTFTYDLNNPMLESIALTTKGVYCFMPYHRYKGTKIWVGMLRRYDCYLS